MEFNCIPVEVCLVTAPQTSQMPRSPVRLDRQRPISLIVIVPLLEELAQAKRTFADFMPAARA
jgi:hypothetical protein